MNRFLSIILLCLALALTHAAGDDKTSTEVPKTTITVVCKDDPDTDCASLKSNCNNSKLQKMLKEFCPVTCNLCPGATTTTPPKCADLDAAKCQAWNRNGFCMNTHYSDEDKKRFCAKTCEYC
ncbi:unnamed protein product [Caenorhabditis angaria]|uniref:ShKT domain-containing protein n=1 Tax=Caenorhabditis angaria TaxID=860376 RepID=A0A9P1MZ88_9PELO|nr:unnamed protein product [Caenorhabditis angaria]